MAMSLDEAVELLAMEIALIKSGQHPDYPPKGGSDLTTIYEEEQ